MYAVTLPSREPRPAQVATLQRAEGEAHVILKRAGGRSVLARLYQRGSARARLPRPQVAGRADILLLNTAGGVTGGDRLRYAVECRAGTAATITTQAHEKVYRSIAGEAHISTDLIVADAAAMEWLPQETALFDAARLRRITSVTLTGTARFLGLEALIFGRTAMGESVRRGFVHDAWRVRRDGKLLFADATHLHGGVAGTLDRLTAAAGQRAAATLLYVAADAESRLDEARAVLQSLSGEAAASAWNGLLHARFLAPDGAALRRDLRAFLDKFRGGPALPRVWQY